MIYLGKNTNKAFYGDKKYFEFYQPAMLILLNNPIHKIREKTREFFGINDNEIISKITPNSIHRILEPSLYIAECYSVDIFSNNMKNNFENLQRMLNKFHWFDLNFANKFVPELNLGFDTLTAYSTTGDGSAVNTSQMAAWSDRLTNGIFTTRSTTNTTDSVMSAGVDDGEGGTVYNNRKLYFYHDTSSIGTGKTITDAVFSLYATSGNRVFTVQKGTQPTPLAEPCFAAFSGSAYGNSPAITTSAYNDITFNATGISDIVVDGTTKLCVREKGYDYDGVTPGQATYSTTFNMADNSTDKPKLVITYSAGATATDKMFLMFK